MRLSDRQYRNCTRTGIVITIAAALAFDRVEITLQPAVLLVAVLGAAIGFFPLITSRAFDTHNPGDEIVEQAVGEEVQHEADRGASFTHQTKPSGSPAQTQLSSRSLEAYLRGLYSAIGSNVGGRDCDPRIYAFGSANISLGRYLFSTLEIERERERADRVHEMHEIVHKLRGTPQAFSVELTSSNSIIVRCERIKESELLDEVVESWDQQNRSTTGALREAVN